MSQVIFNTDGSGYWTTVAKPVVITDIQLNNMILDIPVKGRSTYFGELMVFFSADTWDVRKDGLIYTDRLFERELNRFLKLHALPPASYSEQGMQGLDYVSLDVGDAFCRAWVKKFGDKA